MFDKIEKLGHSLIQHGPNNDRIYLMKLDERDFPSILDQLDDLVIAKRYTKIFAKATDKVLPIFLHRDYKIEATVPGMIKGKEALHFVSRFFGARRAFLTKKMQQKLKKTLEIVVSKKQDTLKMEEPDGITYRLLGEKDAQSLAQIYQQVFKVYPFPIFEPSYLKATMADHIRYFGAFTGDRLVAASSAEMNREEANAEMTDFATLPEFLGQNISYFLLRFMETEMRKLKMKTLYTIARAESVGMNLTFARCDYEFAGTLLNNTLIGEHIESMNVWYKAIS